MTRLACAVCGSTTFWLVLPVSEVVFDGTSVTFRAQDEEWNRDAVKCAECQDETALDLVGCYEITAREIQ